MKMRLLLIPRTDDWEARIIDMGYGFVVQHECPQFTTLKEFRASQFHPDQNPNSKDLGPYYKCLACEGRGGSAIHYEYGDSEKWHRLGVHCNICGHVHTQYNVPSTWRQSPTPLCEEVVPGTQMKVGPDHTGEVESIFLGYLCPPCFQDQMRRNWKARAGKKVGVK